MLWCCGCDGDVDARLTSGAEVYPHRKDLYDLPFWKCDGCGNFVGCHHKTKNRTAPLGCIPTPELKAARQRIHALLDPIWKSGAMGRKEIYAKISERIGWTYHTARIRNMADVNAVLDAIKAAQGEG